MSGVHQAFLKITGYSPNDVTKFVYPDITPEMLRKCENEIVEKQVQTGGFSETYEKEYIRKDASILAQVR